MLPSGQGTLVAPQAHGGGLDPKFLAQYSFYALVDYGSKFLSKPFFSLKIVGSHWPIIAISPYLGESPKSMK